jgi:cell pole-organizing protein PopZ
MFIGQATGTQEPSIEGRHRQLLNALAGTVLVENARTLQDLVCEILRPMLKSWLDDNLPTVVERLVLAEIEQIVGSEPHGERRGH